MEQGTEVNDQVIPTIPTENLEEVSCSPPVNSPF
jgi:hypothetical protein